MKFTAVHYTVIIGFIAGLGGILSTVPHWSQLATPLGLGGLLVQIAAMAGAVFTNSPQAAASAAASVKNAAQKLPIILLAAVLGGSLLSSSSCASTPLRHVAVGAVTALTDALTGIESTADAAVTAGSMSAANRQALAKNLLPALQGTSTLNDTIGAWDPTQPVPAQLTAEATNVQALVGEISSAAGANATLAAALELGVSTAESALISILTRTGNGVPVATTAPVTPGATAGS